MGFVLNIVLWLPLIGGLILLLLRGDGPAERLLIKRWSLGISVLTFLLSLILLFSFDSGNPAFQFKVEAPWLAGMQYKLGVDGFSFPFLMLTTALMPIVFLASWNVDLRVREYFIAFLALETLMIGVFCALDLILFYLFFEASLIPMFLIIGVWGGKRRIYASFKFFLYTLLGSLLMLVAMLWMWNYAGSTDIEVLLKTDFPHASFRVLGFLVTGGAQTLLWLAFFASFAVKMPMWPVHTWLPDAHVEAPTAGSVVLAAILLKMGGYGLVRFNLPMFPVASDVLANFVFFLSVVGIIYGSLVALVQEDMKKLVAYSSVAHMGFVTMGLFSATQQGIDGAMFQMLSHGFVSGALFLCVGVVYDRLHTREIAAYGGVADVMPIFAVVFLFFTMGNVGLPGTSGFVGEFLTMTGAFEANTWVALFAATGVILSAGYALWLYRRVAFGTITNPHVAEMKEMSRREIALFAPLVAATLYFGLYPKPALDAFGTSTAALLTRYEAAVGERPPMALPGAAPAAAEAAHH